LEFHEIANEFPLLGEQETQELADNIKEVGLKQPLMLFENRILDGRNRYRACKLIGRKLGPDDVVLFEEQHDGEDPVEYVIAINVRRRHLTKGQVAAVLVELIKRLPKASGRPKAKPVMPQDRRDNSSEFPEFENDRTISKTEKVAALAKAAGIGLDSVQSASHLEKVAPELHEEVKAGRMSLEKAKKQVRKQAKPKPTVDEHELAWERIKEVCGQQFVDMIKEDQVPGLKPLEQLIAFSKLGDKEMNELRQPLYRAHLSLAHARKVLDRRDPVTKVLRPDWSWTHQETISLMAGDEKQILKRVLETEVGTFVVALARVKPGKEDVKVERVPITESKKENGEDQ
jgi:hypothetical protein